MSELSKEELLAENNTKAKKTIPYLGFVIMVISGFTFTASNKLIAILVFIIAILMLPAVSMKIKALSAFTKNGAIVLFSAIGLFFLSIFMLPPPKPLTKAEQDSVNNAKAIEAKKNAIIDSTNKVNKAFNDSVAEAKKLIENRATYIKEQFNPWDGSHINLEKAIKAAMNDPKSYEHVKTKYIDKGDYLLVETSFRGKNAFGGTVLNSKIVMVDLKGNITSVIKE